MSLRFYKGASLSGVLISLCWQDDISIYGTRMFGQYINWLCVFMNGNMPRKNVHYTVCLHIVVFSHYFGSEFDIVYMHFGKGTVYVVMSVLVHVLAF